MYLLMLCTMIWLVRVDCQYSKSPGYYVDIQSIFIKPTLYKIIVRPYLQLPSNPRASRIVGLLGTIFRVIHEYFLFK